MADLVGQQLGAYTLTEVIGRGGMATIYRARAEALAQDVAVKVLLLEFVEDRDFIHRFRREAAVVAQMEHPHILRVLDFGEQDRFVYLVMPLVTGGDLLDEMNEGPLSLSRAARVLSQVASALTYAHTQGVVHRDLKPENILLDEQRNAYLTDFGIAKIMAGTSYITATGMLVGTPSYMAPEQWRTEPIDGRTDVYALGMLLYEMLVGLTPFIADSPFALMYEHLDKMPTSPLRYHPGLPPGIEPVIYKAVAKAPQDRYPSPTALAEAFAEVVARAPNPDYRPPRPKQRFAPHQEGLQTDLDKSTLEMPIVPKDKLPSWARRIEGAPKVDDDLTPTSRPTPSQAIPAPQTTAPPHAAPPPQQPSLAGTGTHPAASTVPTPDSRRSPALMRILGGIAMLVFMAVIVVAGLLVLNDNGDKSKQTLSSAERTGTALAVQPTNTATPGPRMTETPLPTLTPASVETTAPPETVPPTAITSSAIVILSPAAPDNTVPPDEPPATITPLPTNTPKPTATSEPNATPTNPSSATPDAVIEISPLPTNTSTVTPPPTNTPAPTQTPAPTATSTTAPTATAEPSATPQPTNTLPPPPTATATTTVPTLDLLPTATEEPTLTATPPPTATPAATATPPATPTPAATVTPPPTATPQPCLAQPTGGSAVNMRAGPGAGFAVVDRLLPGENLPVLLRTNTGFAYLYTGWVDDLVVEFSPTEACARVPVIAARRSESAAVCTISTSVDFGDLRVDPDPLSDRVYLVDRGTPLTVFRVVTGTDGLVWYYAATDDADWRFGWMPAIHATPRGDCPPPEGADPTAVDTGGTTSGTGNTADAAGTAAAAPTCFVETTTTSALNVRFGPGIGFDVADQLQPGIQYPAWLRTFTGWAYVGSGWVDDNYVRFSPANCAPTVSNVSMAAAEVCTIVADDPLSDMRTEPAPGADRLYLVANGVQLSVFRVATGSDGQVWYFGGTNDENFWFGWMPASQTRATSPCPAPES